MSHQETGSNNPNQNLYGHDFKVLTEAVVLAQGENLTVGSVLGQKTISVPTTGTAGGTNTGNGTVTAVKGANGTTKGVYTVTCTSVAVDGGTFSVQSPNGYFLPDAVVGTAYKSNEIELLINDGSADFIVGDKFTVTVAVGNFECRLVNSANSDGSQTPKFVLLQDANATSAPVRTVGAITGCFNINKLVFGGADTIETHRANMRLQGLYTTKNQVTTEVGYEA